MVLKLTKKKKKALDEFASRYQGHPNVIGIILSGSHIHGHPGPHSDMDVYIVLDKADWRERGNTWIDGEEIEYFINPVSKIEEYFKEEAKPHNKPSTAHMFANCKVLYKDGKKLDRLIAKAKKIIKKEHAKLKKVEVELAKYSLDDLRKDLEDLFFKDDDFAMMILSHQILDECLKTFYRVKRKPNDKKAKMLQKTLKKLDPKFERLYRAAAIESNIPKKKKKLNSLINYVEKLLGGKRSKEWKIRDKLKKKN